MIINLAISFIFNSFNSNLNSLSCTNTIWINHHVLNEVNRCFNIYKWDCTIVIEVVGILSIFQRLDKDKKNVGYQDYNFWIKISEKLLFR